MGNLEKSREDLLEKFLPRGTPIEKAKNLQISASIEISKEKIRDNI